MFEKLISNLKCAKEKINVPGDTKYFLIFLSVRLLSVLSIQTWYVPDEYWQSIEVAHNLTFGYGYITWEWILGLRSYIHPLIIALLYEILYLFNLDSITLLVVGPRILQATLSAYADLKFYQWSGRHKWAAFNIATSWFWFYTGSRSLINTFETCLTTIALSHFPWPGTENKNIKFLWIAALACYVRPTAAILWLPLSFYHIFFLNKRSDIFKTILKYIAIAVIMLFISISIDSLCHGKFVIAIWQFLKLNLLNDVGSWYGSQPWHWYVTYGLPAVLGIHIIPLSFSIVQSIRLRDSVRIVLISTLVFCVVILSFIPHKEFRFLLPILPIAMYLSSDCISRWSRKANKLYLWLIAAVILISNILPAGYLGAVHQRGTLDVMEPLSELANKRPNDTSFLFLMPCHSTPLYSHLHVNVSTRFLTCEPDLGLFNIDENTPYKDEADTFYENPNKWLHDEYPPTGSLPSHIISFDVLIPKLSSLLSRYKPLHRFAHTSVPVSSRIGYNVIIYQHLDY